MTRRIKVRVSKRLPAEDTLALHVDHENGDETLVLSRQLMEMVARHVGYEPEPEMVASALFKQDGTLTDERQNALDLSMAQRMGTIH